LQRLRLGERFHTSEFDIRYSLFCGSLFNLKIEAGRLIIKDDAILA